MARPTARVLSLLELLQSGGVRTVPELAGRLGVDERTVRRYADHLIDLDVPVESVRGRYGGDPPGAPAPPAPPPPRAPAAPPPLLRPLPRPPGPRVRNPRPASGLARSAAPRPLPGSSEPPTGCDPAQPALPGLASPPSRHAVPLPIQGTIEQTRARLPASIATVKELPSAGGAGTQTERWFRVELHAERRHWLPPLLASLHRPCAPRPPHALPRRIA